MKQVILHPSAFILASGAFVLSLASGCSYLPNTASGTDFISTNSLSYEHPFTDAGAARARKSAERECGYRKQAAVKTGGTCSLSTCNTYYQCMEQADAAKYKE